MIPEIGETWEISDGDGQRIRIVTFVSQDDEYMHVWHYKDMKVYERFHRRGDAMPEYWRKIAP